MSTDVSVFVVTGAARGLGLAAAKRLAKRGTVLLCDINAPLLEKETAQLRSEGLKVQSQVCDISDKASVEALAAAAAALGKVRGLANFAGVTPTVPDWKKAVRVDLVGTRYVLDAFLPYMEPGSAAVAIASMAGHLSPRMLDNILRDPLAEDLIEKLNAAIISRVNPAQAPGTAYTLSKRGVLIMVELLASTWGEHGCRIVSLSPGTCDTEDARQALANADESTLRAVRMVPVGKRLGRPEEIAAVVDFLLSDEASFISGTDIRVDGGIVAVMNKGIASTGTA